VSQVQSYIAATGSTFPVLRNAQYLQSVYGIFYDNYVVIDEDGIVRYTSVNEPFTSLGRFHDGNLRNAILGEVTSTGDAARTRRFAVTSPVLAGAPVTVRLAAPAPRGTTLALLDARGRRVRDLVSPEGWNVQAWSATGTAGEPLATGVYFVQLRAPGAPPEARKLAVVAR